MFVQDNLFSAKQYLQIQLQEAQSFSYAHDELVTIYAQFAEQTDRTYLFPKLQTTYDSIFDNLQTIEAGMRHLHAIERLHDYDDLKN